MASSPSPPASPAPAVPSSSGVTKRYRAQPAKTFQCRGYGECRMVFSRSEHLARHVRKHTGERPFTCHCTKQFSRLDNLRQHAQTVHADKAEQNEAMMRELTSLHTAMAAGKGRKRSSQATSPPTPNVTVPSNAVDLGYAGPNYQLQSHHSLRPGTTAGYESSSSFPALYPTQPTHPSLPRHQHQHAPHPFRADHATAAESFQSSNSSSSASTPRSAFPPPAFPSPVSPPPHTSIPQQQRFLQHQHHQQQQQSESQSFRLQHPHPHASDSFRASSQQSFRSHSASPPTTLISPLSSSSPVGAAYPQLAAASQTQSAHAFHRQSPYSHSPSPTLSAGTSPLAPTDGSSDDAGHSFRGYELRAGSGVYASDGGEGYGYGARLPSLQSSHYTHTQYSGGEGEFVLPYPVVF